MKTLVSAGVAMIIALAVAPAEARPVARTATVTLDKLAFGAVSTSLHVGDSVLWANRDVFRHSSTAKGHFDVDLPPGSRRRMLLTRAGVFPFTCKYHPGMKGVLKVSQ